MNAFKTPALKELADQQVRFTPPARRIEQLARAERLLSELDRNKQYPYQFVCFRITDYRSDLNADLLIDGETLVKLRDQLPLSFKASDCHMFKTDGEALPRLSAPKIAD